MNSVYLKGINKLGFVSGGIFFIIISFLFLCKTMEAKMESPYEKVMEEKCTKCHSTQRILFLKRTPEEWSVTVRRMKEKAPMWLSNEDVTGCINFLSLNYVKTGRDSFEKLCVGCHKMIGKNELLYQRKTGPAWTRAIERMQRKYNFFIGVTDAKQINEFLIDPRNNKNLKLDSDETGSIEGVFENKCGRCHTYPFMYGQKKTGKDWLEVLDRMQEKNPLWIDQQDLEQIKKYIFSNRKLLLDKN